MIHHVQRDRVSISTAIVNLPQFFDYFEETAMLFLHLLMVASALFCLSSGDKLFHRFEDLVHPPHMFVEEMLGI